MSEELFRKKSLTQVSSPDNLNDYIRVTNPGVWLLLGAIIVLLAGVCVWGIFGHADTVVSAVARVENGVITCIPSESDASRLQTGMSVKLEGVKGVLSVSDTQIEIIPDEPIADGVYSAEITVERVKPMSFITN